MRVKCGGPRARRRRVASKRAQVKPCLGGERLRYGVRSALLSVFLTFGVLSAEEADPFVALAVEHVDTEIRFDGRLDDPAWREAAVIDHLTQQAPFPGQTTPFDTHVFVLLRDSKLYIGFRCIDPEPRRISIHTRKLDGQMDGDDWIGVALDTLGDRRTGYALWVNAGGARWDGLISGPSELSSSWDGIWDARTELNAEGWTAEIVVPLQTLTFDPNLDAWGMQLERFIPRVQTMLRWASPTLDSSFSDMRRTGRLTGLSGQRQGKGIEITPYAVGRKTANFPAGANALEGDLGLDASYRVGPQLNAIVSVNTDFAETEVDTRQVNLTRFPLFFPEKRAFFAEGSNFFQFGSTVRRRVPGSFGTPFIPFFSRRIGLDGGQQVPIDLGAKLVGSAGPWTIGVLNTRMRETGSTPATNLLAGRITYDLSPALRVGTIFTHGDPDGVTGNSLLGGDITWNSSQFMGDKNIQVNAWWARTFTEKTADAPAEGSEDGFGASVRLPNDRHFVVGRFAQFGDAMNPALGFLPRRGIRTYDGNYAFGPRPSEDGAFGWIQQYRLEAVVNAVTGLDNVLQSFNGFFAPVNIAGRRGDFFQLQWNPNYERLTEPFPIASGVRIPTGEYRFDRLQVDAISSDHRLVQAGIQASAGEFYDGSLRSLGTLLRWTSRTARWDLTNETISNFGRLPAGNFVQRLWQQRVEYAFNQYLTLTLYGQYDSQSNSFGMNNRFRWTIEPGKDLFLVWNRGWQRSVAEPRDLSLIPDTEFVGVKLRWTLRY